MLHSLSGLKYTGSITLKDQIPSISVGRRIVATILSQPKGGLVLVSLFGRRLLVETTINLSKGQVLNLRVHSVHPKIVLKPVDNFNSPMRAQKVIDSIVERFVGVMGKAHLSTFNIKEIIQHALSRAAHDMDAYKLIISLLEESSKFPQALAFLLIPIVERDSRGSARVVIEGDKTKGYTVKFCMDTDHIGTIGCTVRLCDGIDMEIISNLKDVADLLRSHLGELADRLDGLGLSIRRLEVVHKNLPVGDTGLDMVV
ncbi:MAG: hypothetical protein J7L53_08900 [Deltaproteobacteria bacterium]|nr:hypothetical protein [Deltaproteobacteria bacterium]